MKKFIDLRSDTVTLPTDEMRRAMTEAEVGDDVYGEDPTVNQLQDRAAEIFEREAALFVPSGTMGNQIAVKLHTTPGQEVIMEERAHIFNYEMATMAAFSGCLARPVRSPGGHLKWSQIETVVNSNSSYRARTGLVALENTHNMAGGTVMNAGDTSEVVERARARGLPVHLDGARIFNAAEALGQSVADLSGPCDSVMFCLSKGLCAPVGSLLVGNRDWIAEARRIRKMMGGGMRQVGVLAAAGLVALERMPQRLSEDHENARFLAEALSEMNTCCVDLDRVHTNIVLVDLASMSSAEFLARLKNEDVLAGPTGPSQVRFVVHKDVARNDIEKVIQSVERLTADN